MGFGKDGKGTILRETQDIVLGALGAQSAVKSSAQLAITDDFRLLKTEYFVALSAFFQAVGDEVIIGIADNELTVAEIAACINADGPLDRNDRVPEELSHRAVWLLTQVKGTSTTVPDVPGNDGKAFECKLRWTFCNPEGWTWFAYNPLGLALTTGGQFKIVAKHYGVWVT